VGRTGWRMLVAAIIGSSACSPLRAPIPQRATALFTLSGESHQQNNDIRTVSAALDRIGKRTPRLDGTLRRSGTGRGVAIYVFDGGVSDRHPELSGRVRIGFDAFPSTPRLCNPHGTAVAGAAAGATLGVAPDAEIVDVKIINCESARGSVAAILAGAKWSAADHARHPDQPAIANWSFSVDTGRTVPEIDSAATILREAGILLVAAAGNLDLDACRVSPANTRSAIVVGASALVSGDTPSAPRRDVRAPNTAWGKCVTVYAPGDSVQLPSLDRGVPTVMAWNGTSMAAGYVSGAAALILERDPTSPPARVAEIIIASATPGAVDERRAAADGSRARLLYIGPPERVLAAK